MQNLRLIIGRETLPKGALRLEIAESLVNSNPEQAIEIIDWLKSLNVSVALDEFGVSFSSLSYWHRLNIDAIKIDRSLVALSDKERSSAMVLKAVLTIAHELGKDVVAVGVDSDEDLAYVQAVGCDYGQGFYFSELMSEREVVHLLNSIARSVRRDDKEQEKEAKRSERRAAKEREREEKEKERALVLAEADARESAKAAPATGENRRDAGGNRRPRIGLGGKPKPEEAGSAAERPRSNVPVPEPARLLPGDVPPPRSSEEPGRSMFPFGRRRKS